MSQNLLSAAVVKQTEIKIKKNLRGNIVNIFLPISFYICFECSIEQSKYWVGSVFCKADIPLWSINTDNFNWCYGRVGQIKRQSANIAILLLSFFQALLWRMNNFSQTFLI